MNASVRHFVVIKREGFTAAGVRLSAAASAQTLLDAKVWPLWSKTRNRRVIAAGHRLAVYLSGDGGSRVVATANVEAVGPWTPSVARAYPLDLDGTPEVVLHLTDVCSLEHAIEVKPRLDRLSFVSRGSAKWGVAFMGGTRAVSAADFAVLTQ